MNSKDKIEIKTKYGSFLMYRGVDYAVVDRNFDIRVYRHKKTRKDHVYWQVGKLVRSRILYRTLNVSTVLTKNNINIVNINSEMLQDTEVLDITINDAEYSIPTALLKLNKEIYELDDILAIKYNDEETRKQHSTFTNFEYVIQLLEDDKVLNYSTFKPNIATMLKDNCFIDDMNLNSNSFYFSGYEYLSTHAEIEHYKNDYIELDLFKIKLKDLSNKVYLSEHGSAGRCKVTLYNYLLGVGLKDLPYIEIGATFSSYFQGALIFCEQDKTINPESTIYIGLNIRILERFYRTTFLGLYDYIAEKYKNEEIQ